MRNFAILAAVAALTIPVAAQAQAIITNGTVGLGVDRAGQLNIASTNRSNGAPGASTTAYGLRDIATNHESTADGCLCEGWGAAVAGVGHAVYANNANANSKVIDSFTSTATTATSRVHSVDGALGVLQEYSTTVTPYLFMDKVTITNLTGADFTGATLYRRTMDWDIEPTAFREYSTIQGTTGATHVLDANDNGFCNSNPLAGCASLGSTGDFIDSGPRDHGANFTFTFDALKAGASQSLFVFYGVAPTRSAAIGALAAVGAEVYSFGNSSLGGHVNDQTFIFGFKGVGGTVIHGVPEPTSWALMIMGAGLVGASLRTSRRRRIALAA